MRRIIALMVAVAGATFLSTGCGDKVPLATAPLQLSPSSTDTTITIRDTCTTVVTGTWTFSTNPFTLGSPGTKRTLFEGTSLCERTTLSVALSLTYSGADGNTPAPVSVWVQDVDQEYAARPCTWRGGNIYLQLPNRNGTYADTASVEVDDGVQFPSGTAVTAYVYWGTGTPTAQQFGATGPTSTQWHYDGSGRVTKICRADSCWSDTTIVVTRH